MGRRTIPDDERARRAARGVHFAAMDAECDRARAAAKSVDLYCAPDWWLNRACREELGAAPYALDDELLPAAVRIAKRLAFQVEQYVDRLPAIRTADRSRKEWKSRMEGLKDAMRCEVRRAPAPAANEVVPGKTLGEYVRERLRAKARAGPVPAMQVPERENPASWQARGVQVKQASTLECADMANGTTPAAKPQQPPPVGVFWSEFELYGVTFVVTNKAIPDRCESAAEKLLDDSERIQEFVEVDLVGGEDRALDDEMTSTVIGAARIMNLVGRSLADAARRLRFEAREGVSHD